MKSSNTVNSLKGSKFWRDDYTHYSLGFREQSMCLGNGFYCEFSGRLIHFAIISFTRGSSRFCGSRFVIPVSVGISSRHDSVGKLWILAIFSAKFHYTITAASRYGYKLINDLYWDLRRVKSGSEFAKLLNQFIAINATSKCLELHRGVATEIKHLDLARTKASKESCDE
jgi:hypothetical protein